MRPAPNGENSIAAASSNGNDMVRFTSPHKTTGAMLQAPTATADNIPSADPGPEARVPHDAATAATAAATTAHARTRNRAVSRPILRVFEPGTSPKGDSITADI